MNKIFISTYAERIEQFIQMKKSLGFKYTKEIQILSLMDRLAYERGETSLGITKEFADKWSEINPDHTENYRYTKMQKMAMFSAYLVDIGIPSYIPKLPPPRKDRYTLPYIYSKEEILALFEGSDKLFLNIMTYSSMIFSMPALIRLLYATGLRIGEALALKEEDINLDEKYLIVKDSKNGKERMIPFSESINEVLLKYLYHKRKLPVKKKTNHFFVKLDGYPVKDTGSLRKWFSICRQNAGINSGARIHDLRHTFACHALENMVRSGIDIYTSLPILSTYLGHQSLEATNRYVRLTSSIYPELLKNVDMLCLNVFPKTKNYETY